MAYHNIYVGIRYRDVPFVAVNGKPLSPRQDLIEHSSKGFEWGYGGCRPTQLALAILAHELTDAQALDHHHRFKWDIIASLPHQAWTLYAEDIHG
ncbi:MAG: DUF6166 domain-containing protein [Gammaproteobacteria bacterium]|nr:DUF6166 domain-containing protein [Gammaproteobacteria bacterium]